MDTSIKKNFTFWVDIIRKGTSFAEDDINKYSNEELYALGGKVIEEMNKKK